MTGEAITLAVVGAVLFLAGFLILLTASSIFVGIFGGCLWLTGAGAVIAGTMITALRKP